MILYEVVYFNGYLGDFFAESDRMRVQTYGDFEPALRLPPKVN